MKRIVLSLFLLLFVISCHKKAPTDQAPVVNDNTPELALRRANELLGMKQCNQAIPYYRQFLAKYTRDTGAWNMLGLACVCDSQFYPAIQAFQQALAIQ